MLKIKNISKSFKTQSELVTPIRDLSLEIVQGEVVAVVGKSGCGKSTLLNIIASVLEPTDGEIVSSLTGTIGYMFQNPPLLPWKTVFENICYPGDFLKIENIEERAKNALDLIKLQDFHSFYPGELSEGMRSRVALAQCFSLEPELFLLDEPFSNLDEISREELNLEFLKIRRRLKSSVVFVTHDIAEAVFVSDRVLVLSDKQNEPSVKEVIHINLPRPREVAHRRLPEFSKLVEDVKEIL